MKPALPDAVPLRYSPRGFCGRITELGSLICCLVLLNGCGFSYLWHVTVGQAKLLIRRQPVAQVLRDTHLSERERHKIRLILDVKAFAGRYLGLHASDSYTTFVRVDGPYISYNLSAAPKDALRPYVWYFPLIGRVPYKGFFHKRYALREQQQLEAEGYDTYVRGVQAYSTLGYFDDPIFSSMLSRSDFSLINTTIHELLHQTVWIKGHISFNESLASFVGERGTLAYLIWRYGATSPAVQRYREIQADAAVFRAYLQTLIEQLERLYRQPWSFEEKMRRREQLFAAARTNYSSVFPRMKTPYYRHFFPRQRLNNAVLLSFRRYQSDTAFFEQALAAQGGDLRRMIAFFKTLRPSQIPATFRER